MKQAITLTIDGSIEIAALAKALATIGCTIASDETGGLRVSKRRIRARPTLAVVEGKPEKK